MAYRVTLSPQARSDAREAAAFIRDQAGPDQARRWKNGLLDAIASLSEMPLRCAVAPESQELGAQMRQLVYYSHRVLFRVIEAPPRVEVLRVYHSARAPLRLEDLP